MSDSPYQLTTAPNGLTVLRVPRPSTEAVTVLFFFRAGARYETKQTNGLAHFTEHMVFKGGERYPTFQKVNDAINQVGGYFNAYTSDEVTAFYVKAAATQVRVALDVLSDILASPLYDQTELDKERGVIIEEINMYEDEPSSQVPVLLDETIFPNHPLGWPILGPKDNINSFPRDYFADYTKRYFTPDRGVLVVTGNLDLATDKVVNEFVERFSGSSDAAPPSPPRPHDSAQFKLKKRKTEQTHLGLALRGPALADREASVRLEVLSMILGGNSSSRLFTEVREKQGLAYAVHSYPDQVTDAGSLDVYAGVSNDKAPQALSAILHELRRLRDGDLSDQEVAIGKESLKGTRALRWEDSTSLGTLYGIQHLLLGDIKTPAELLAMVEAVTKEEIVALAEELVVDQRLHAVVLGPQDKQKFQKLITCNR